MRVVDRVHRDAAHRRTDAAPALAPALPIERRLCSSLPTFADGRAAIDVHLADLARAQAQLRVRALARQQLHRCAGRARDLRTLARQHLDAMNRRADRDVAQRQAIAGLDRRFGAAHQLRAGRHAAGRDDVAALAVRVAQQREMRAAVRVVFEPLDLRGDAVLVAAEIDHAIVLLVSAALVPRRDMAVVVAARPRFLLSVSASNGAPLCSSLVTTLTSDATAGRCGFDFDQCHVSPLRGEVDFLARLEAHVRLLPVAPAADCSAPKRLCLALDVGDLHRLDFDLEHQLDRRLDLGLGRVRHDAKTTWNACRRFALPFRIPSARAAA